MLAGRVEQGVVKPGDEVLFLPTHTTANPCVGKVFTVEMHHKRVDKAGPGDNVGMNIKGLDKGNMPRTGDVMILKSDATLKIVKDFTAQIQTLDIPGEVKAGYSPIGFVRCGRSACRVAKVNWKVGKETGGKKLEAPANLKVSVATTTQPGRAGPACGRGDMLHCSFLWPAAIGLLVHRGYQPGDITLLF